MRKLIKSKRKVIEDERMLIACENESWPRKKCIWKVHKRLQKA
jgi:hypothetical protein